MKFPFILRFVVQLRGCGEGAEVGRAGGGGGAMGGPTCLDGNTSQRRERHEWARPTRIESDKYSKSTGLKQIPCD